MSQSDIWAAASRINSDFLHEPLNFLAYIYDISVFGADSYVLNVSNENLWRMLLKDSLTMFGHDAIHEYVYTRMTADDADYLVSRNSRLGQALNSYYNTDVFAAGGIDEVLNGITNASYNVMDDKIRAATNRYISAKTEGNAVGPWIAETFDLPEFAAHTTIGSILADADLWTGTILQNEALIVVVSNSMPAIAQSGSMDDETFLQFVQMVAGSTLATTVLMEVLTGSDKLATFFADEQVCEVVAANAESMRAIVCSTAGFAAMIASETAMAAVGSSDVASEVIAQAVEDMLNSETALASIQSSLTSIQTQLGNIPGTEPAITEVADTITSVTNAISNLQSITGQADILAANVEAMLNSTAVMTALLTNVTSRDKLFANTAAVQSMANNSNSVNLIISIPGVLNSLLGNSAASSIMFNNPNSAKILANNQNAFNLYAGNTAAKSLILNSDVMKNALNSSSLRKYIQADGSGTDRLTHTGSGWAAGYTAYTSSSYRSVSVVVDDVNVYAGEITGTKTGSASRWFSQKIYVYASSTCTMLLYYIPKTA